MSRKFWRYWIPASFLKVPTHVYLSLFIPNWSNQLFEEDMRTKSERICVENWYWSFMLLQENYLYEFYFGTERNPFVISLLFLNVELSTKWYLLVVAILWKYINTFVIVKKMHSLSKTQQVFVLVYPYRHRTMLWMAYSFHQTLCSEGLTKNPNKIILNTQWYW